MTNQYLEKVALNATKARALAHEAGVVVDHKTQWKWALRQLRDSRGEVKVGKERAEALSRLLGKPAAGPNNFLQAVRSEQRKLRDVDEVQLHRPRNIREYEASNTAALGANSTQDTFHRYQELPNPRLNTLRDTHTHPTTKVTPWLLSQRSRNTGYEEIASRVLGGSHYSAGPSGGYINTTGYKTGLYVTKGGDVSAQMNKDTLRNQPISILSGDTLGLHRMIYSGGRPAGYRQAYIKV